MSELDFSKQAKEFLSGCASQKLFFVDKLSELLAFKVEKHNNDCEFKVSFDLLKKIYFRGSQAFEYNHSFNTTKAQWAVCRVNVFLKLLRGSSDFNKSYLLVDLDLASACGDFTDLNIEEKKIKDFYGFSDFSLTEFAVASVDLAKFNIHKWEQNNDDEELFFSDAEKKVLNKPFRLPKGSRKKFGVYVKNPKTGNIIMVKFGDPNMEIKRDDPERRKNFRARHKCDTAKDKTTPRYWSCKMWSKKPVNKSVSSEALEWDDEELLSEWGWDETFVVDYEDFFHSSLELNDLEVIEDEQ